MMKQELDGANLKFFIPFRLSPPPETGPEFLLREGEATLEWDGENIICHCLSGSPDKFLLPEWALRHLTDQTNKTFLLKVDPQYQESIAQESTTPTMTLGDAENSRISPDQYRLSDIDALADWESRMKKKP